MKLRNFYRNGFVQYLAAAGATVLAGTLVGKFSHRVQVIDKIDRIVDYNKDYNATENEWSIVYDELGLKNSGQKGNDLTISQLEKYLNAHEGELK